MEWSQKDTLKFIEVYKKRPLLWSLKHKFHYHKIKRNDAWIDLAAEINKSPEECKQKCNNLLAAFRPEKIKIKKVETGKDKQKY